VSQQINLLNSAVRERRSSFAALSAVAAALLLVLAATAGVAIHERQRTHALALEVQKSASALKDARAVLDKRVGAGQTPKSKPAVEAEIALLEKQLQSRQDVIDALRTGVVGTTTGFAAYMRAFSRQAMNGIWITGFDASAGGRELTVNGRVLSADLVPVYLRRLQQEPAFQGRQFASLLINPGEPARNAHVTPPVQPPQSAPAAVAGATSTKPPAPPAPPVSRGGTSATAAPASGAPPYLDFRISSAELDEAGKLRGPGAAAQASAGKGHEKTSLEVLLSTLGANEKRGEAVEGAR
jgi:hypothetical protein